VVELVTVVVAGAATAVVVADTMVEVLPRGSAEAEGASPCEPHAATKSARNKSGAVRVTVEP
jgi:hypothetical protein